uniref:Uncharacterized protein n=1 Tax=Biomphalaria glabrata TaxID=6526 RepID=A0A2C9LPY9_BIOGL
MYYRKGTDQHLTFLRNMREAHAMYPFTGKRDKELFDKALAELLLRMPILQRNENYMSNYFYQSTMERLKKRKQRYHCNNYSLKIYFVSHAGTFKC